MVPRWTVERKARTNEGDLLIIVEVYAEGESKELAKIENKVWTHRRELLLVERSKVAQ